MNFMNFALPPPLLLLIELEMFVLIQFHYETYLVVSVKCHMYGHAKHIPACIQIFFQLEFYVQLLDLCFRLLFILLDVQAVNLCQVF